MDCSHLDIKKIKTVCAYDIYQLDDETNRLLLNGWKILRIYESQDKSGKYCNYCTMYLPKNNKTF